MIDYKGRDEHDRAFEERMERWADDQDEHAEPCPEHGEPLDDAGLCRLCRELTD